MRKDYKERLMVIGCGDVEKATLLINDLCASTNQDFDVILTSIEQVANKTLPVNQPLLDFDSLIPKEKPLLRQPFKGYHNSKRKQLRK